MITYLQTLVATLMSGSLPARPVRAGRGATFIEYMLLAAIAVLLFIAIYAALNGAFGNILNKITDALNI